MYMNWQRGWNGILDEMMHLLHKLSIDPSIVLRSLVRALAWTRVPAWACCLEGREAGRAGVRRACLRDRQLLGWLDFLVVVAIRYY
jgi:hypothetical protein